MSDDNNNVVSMRNNRGQFIKGNNANPTGVSTPRPLREIKRTNGGVEEMFRANSVLVYEELLKLILHPKTPAGAKASAIKTFFERGYGKPSMTVTTPDEQVYDGFDVSKLSTDVLAEVVRVANGAKGDE